MQPGAEPQTSRCVAFCTATSYAIRELTANILKTNQKEYDKTGNVVHRRYGEQDGDIFYFSYGVIVMWGISKSDEQALLEELKPYENERVDTVESEPYLFTYGGTAKIVRNQIVLPSADIVEKLAMSHGLAQSVKLSVFESMITKIIDQTRYIPQSLAVRGKIPLSRKQITKLMGQFFVERNLVNLHSDILDTPEFFWEHSELESLYTLIEKDLDIDARVEVLNKRLDVVKELFDMLGTELNQRHSTALEWTIVMLILIEIILGVLKDVLHLI